MGSPKKQVSNELSGKLRDLGFKHQEDHIFANLTGNQLIEHSVRNEGAKLTTDGALAVYSGEHTGRAPKDKYVVVSTSTENKIDWENNLNKMSPELFQELKGQIIEFLNARPRLYVSEKNVGSLEKYSLNVELFSECASHNLFFDYLMRNDGFDAENKGLGTFRIFHAPFLKFDPNKYDLRSSTVIALDLDTREVLVAGSRYSGEIKKSVFSVMNYMLPELGILPMHSGANLKDDNASVFFGLSGTGKTTLSTQVGHLIIGDDEHGLSSEGLFNFEGGCYAKTYKLSQKNEPEIYAASTRFGSFLENVFLNDEQSPDFDDKSIAENGRCAYPLEFIDERVDDSRGPTPKNMFFLSADAFGVLPPIARLTKEQAMYYFLSGYTAKLAGTEVGVKEPQATFSTCFGAPFMMQKPKVYAELLGQMIEKLNIKVWLVNTGWTGGAYGVGERFPLPVTRTIIEAVQTGSLDDVETESDPIFGLHIPKEVKGVQAELLKPWLTWKDQAAYTASAQNLANMFHKNFVRFSEGATAGHKGAPTFAASETRVSGNERSNRGLQASP